MTEMPRFKIYLPSKFAAVTRDPKKDGPARTRAEGLGLPWHAEDECYRTSDESAAEIMEKLGCDVFDRMLPGYERDIWRATGCAVEDAAAIEELMRVEYPTLNHLDRRRFNKIARDAKSDLAWLRRHDPETAAFYEGMRRV